MEFDVKKINNTDVFHTTYSRSGDSITRSIVRRSGAVAVSTQGVCLDSRDISNADHFDLSWLRSEKRPSYKSEDPEVRIADLFCGCGGMSLGLVEACRALSIGSEIAFANDFVKQYIDVYSDNFTPHQASCDPIETMFDCDLGEKISPAERSWKRRLGKLTIAVGGPPCQGHSDLNNHTRRVDPRNNLYAKMARFAEVTEPEHLIIENVLGVKHDRSGVFDKTANALLRMGYNLDIPVIRANEIGVPQRRNRAFIVASKSVKLHLGFFDSVIQSYNNSERTVKWACQDLLNGNRRSPLDETSVLSIESRKRVDWMFENNAYDLPDELRPSCHRDKHHTYKSVYGRLFWDKPAWTITTGFLVMGQGRFIHPIERRVITPHEGARLQFFPDFFNFGVRTRHEYAKMIGNAVPAKMAFVIATELLR